MVSGLQISSFKSSSYQVDNLKINNLCFAKLDTLSENIFYISLWLSFDNKEQKIREQRCAFSFLSAVRNGGY